MYILIEIQEVQHRLSEGKYSSSRPVVHDCLINYIREVWFTDSLSPYISEVGLMLDDFDV